MSHCPVLLDDLIISDSNIAIAIFQKKEEFGPAKMKISNGYMLYQNIPVNWRILIFQ